MITAMCPECDTDVELGNSPQQGDSVSCEECGEELEITSLEPPKVDYIEGDSVLDDDDEDEDEDEEVLNPEALAKLYTPEGVRTEIINARYAGPSIYAVIGPKQATRFITIFAYGMAHPSRGGRRGRKGKPSVDIPKLVAAWVPAIIKLSTAHDKDANDEAEATLDDLLSPLLSCPVKQLRKFYSALVKALKADPACPMVVWKTYEAWGAGVIEKASDEDVIHLKEDLAREIVQLCEKDAKEQLPEAIARALMWRPAERLQEVKSALQQGGKARMTGRESCLYLEITPRGKRKPTASVML